MAEVGAKLGLGSYAYRWAIGRGGKQPAAPLGPLGLVDKALEHNLTLLQIADNMPLQALNAKTCEALARRAAESGVELELGTDGVTNGNARTYLDLAARLDAKLVRLTLSRDDLSLPRRTLVRALQDAAEAYAEMGVTLALENHFLLTSRELLELLGAVNHPSVGICLDVANSIASGEWPETTVTELAPFAVNLHLKDYRFATDPDGVGFSAVGVPLGEGALDIDTVFATLAAAERRLNVVLEHWLPYTLITANGLGVEDEWTAKSVAAARNYVEE